MATPRIELRIGRRNGTSRGDHETVQLQQGPPEAPLSAFPAETGNKMSATIVASRTLASSFLDRSDVGSEVLTVVKMLTAEGKANDALRNSVASLQEKASQWLRISPEATAIHGRLRSRWGAPTILDLGSDHLSLLAATAFIRIQDELRERPMRLGATSLVEAVQRAERKATSLMASNPDLLDEVLTETSLRAAQDPRLAQRLRHAGEACEQTLRSLKALAESHAAHSTSTVEDAWLWGEVKPGTSEARGRCTVGGESRRLWVCILILVIIIILGIVLL